MKKTRTNLYFFGWPSHLGGADTKLVHVLGLLCSEYAITMVPNEIERLEEGDWLEWLGARNIQVQTWDQLPARMTGWGVTFCNGWMLREGRIPELQRRGLKFAWSNDMMWHFDTELGLLMAGILDNIIYVSDVQREALEPRYRHAWTGAAVHPSVPLENPGAVSGTIAAPDDPKHKLRWVNTGNYIDPDAFPYIDRWTNRPANAPLRLGRLSRPDADKFPVNFPETYENLGLKNATFHVMGWNKEVACFWPDHKFDERWHFLPPVAMPSVQFLQGLDFFVYDLSPRFRESWGRAAVESMLTGAIPLVPGYGGHHLRELVNHGVGGFVCENPADYKRYLRRLEKDPELCAQMSRAARDHAANVLNNTAEHRRWWRILFAGK